MKNEKSPGEDGLPREFYHKYFHLLKEEMSELYNYIYMTLNLPVLRGQAYNKIS